VGWVLESVCAGCSGRSAPCVYSGTGRACKRGIAWWQRSCASRSSCFLAAGHAPTRRRSVLPARPMQTRMLAQCACLHRVGLHALHWLSTQLIASRWRCACNAHDAPCGFRCCKLRMWDIPIGPYCSTHLLVGATGVGLQRRRV